MGNIDDLVQGLGADQHGAFSRFQVVGLGCPAGIIRSRTRTGRWIRRTAGVYSLVGAPDTWRQRLWIAHLDVGPRSMVSHESAAQLHGLGGVARQQIVLSSDRRQGHDRAGLTLHRPTDLLPVDRTTVDSLPVTNVARTIVDLSAVISAPRLSIALQDAVAGNLTSFASVGDLMLRVSRRGKPGMTRLAGALDQLGGNSAVPRSELERRLDNVLDGVGAAFTGEYPLPSDGSMEGFVDRVNLRSKVIVEGDGRRWHARLQTMAKDRQRDRVAAAQGFLTVRVMWEDLVNDPGGVASDVRATIAQRSAA